MTTDQLTRSQRDASRLFLEGQGWGFGGTGTAAHITPPTGAITILLSQVELAGPTPPALMREFWRYVADI